MALGSNNPFPSVLFVESTAAPTAPSTGRQRVYIDTTLHHLNRVTSSGGTVDLEVITEAKQSLSDVTTLNTSTGKHGYAPKLPGDATKYLDGTGAFTVPSSTGGGSGTPGGSDKYVQYNNGGSFGGIAPGAVGTVLMSNSTSSTPSFQYPGMVLLEQHTASGSASLAFTTFYSSAYDEYLIEIIEIVPGTTASELYLQFSTDGGANYSTSGYHWGASLMFTDSATAATYNNDSASGISVFSSNPKMNTGTGRAGYGSFRISGLANTSLYKTVHGTMICAASNGVFGGGTIIGMWGTSTAVTALRLIASSGTIATGTARVYGVAK